MERIAELVERQRLDVPLDLRRRLTGIALREGSELRRRHGERPGLEERVFERHRRFPEYAVHALVQCRRIFHLVLHANLQVIVQIRAGSRGAVAPKGR